MKPRPLCLFAMLGMFVICRSSHGIAQTIANQPSAPSAQGATPGNAPPPDLEQEINSEVAEAGNGKASLTEVNKELSNPIFDYLGPVVSAEHLLVEQA
jgi:hypothetical protein